MQRPRTEEHRNEEMNLSVRTNTHAERILDVSGTELERFFLSAVREHARILKHKKDAVRKDAPESAVTVARLQGFPPVCVKEFQPRGSINSLKALFRPSKGLRSFKNGQRLRDEGIGAALPLALVRNEHRPQFHSEWIIMEVIPDALELDRYVLSKIAHGWTLREHRHLVRSLGKFIGLMHAKGIVHSDMKTCNIMVSEDSGPHFALVDYDDVIFSNSISTKTKVKSLIQIFLSSPIAFGPADRMRFLREYAGYGGINAAFRRRLARKIADAVSGKSILYVGFDGDIVEKWE
jgi:serine/threonine protein kinase